MNIKGDFYKLSSEEFNKKLQQIKNDENTLCFFANTGTPYFYFETPEISSKILALNKKQWEFDRLFQLFSAFGQNQLMQSFLIDEICSTNEIENIFSTRHDIFYLLKNDTKTGASKYRTITKSYSLLLESNHLVTSKKQIRQIYDFLFEGLLKKEELPDGEFFRKQPVYISDGIKNVHTGIFPEGLINETMDEYLALLNSDKEIYLKNIVAHFLFETIHPFYDGNGRLGRYLFSNSLLNQTGSYFSLLISKAFNHHKTKYYKAFKEGRDIHRFGCINDYVDLVLSILIETIDEEIIHLALLQKQIQNFTVSGKTKSETILLQLLGEAALLSDYGVSNEELMTYSSLSKRTVIHFMKEFKEQGLLEEQTIGKTTYHKLSRQSQPFKEKK